ncbi:MAG TPA: hypothetical protein VHF26_15020 [Trebonia sp.]|nr:hypothetical protein [Trebonia sp.]
MSAPGAQYTDSRLKLVVRILLRGALCCFASGSGILGGVCPACTAYQAAEEAFPRLIWYRTAARAGVADAEVFANTGVAPAPKPGPARLRPRWEALRHDPLPGDGSA